MVTIKLIEESISFKRTIETIWNIIAADETDYKPIEII